VAAIELGRFEIQELGESAQVGRILMLLLAPRIQLDGEPSRGLVESSVALRGGPFLRLVFDLYAPLFDGAAERGKFIGKLANDG
jgi:hypothetical protein